MFTWSGSIQSWFRQWTSSPKEAPSRSSTCHPLVSHWQTWLPSHVRQMAERFPVGISPSKWQAAFQYYTDWFETSLDIIGSVLRSAILTQDGDEPPPVYVQSFRGQKHMWPIIQPSIRCGDLSSWSWPTLREKHAPPLLECPFDPDHPSPLDVVYGMAIETTLDSPGSLDAPEQPFKPHLDVTWVKRDRLECRHTA